MTASNTAGNQAAPGAAANAPANGGAAAPSDKGAQQVVPITALHEEREKRQALAEKVESLQSQLEKLAGNTQHQTAPAAAPNADQQAQLDALWRTDPRAAMRHEMSGALEWADRVNQAVEDRADALAGSKEYADFSEYRSEVMRKVRALPLSQRGQPGVVETAYLLVKGSQAESMAARRAAEAVGKVKSGEAAGAGAAVGGNAGGQAQVQTGLSDHEKAAAAAMGISEDEYLKYRKR